MEKQNRKKVMVLTVALFFTLGLGAATAQPGPKNPFGQGGNGNSDTRPVAGHNRPDPFIGCVMQLELSSDTTGAIETLLEESRTAREEHRDVMQEARDAYVAALTSEVMDEDALIAAQETLTELRQEHGENRFALEQAIVELLSSDEKADLSDCLSNRTPQGEPSEDSQTEAE